MTTPPLLVMLTFTQKRKKQVARLFHIWIADESCEVLPAPEKIIIEDDIKTSTLLQILEDAGIKITSHYLNVVWDLKRIMSWDVAPDLIKEFIRSMHYDYPTKGVKKLCIHITPSRRWPK